MSSLKSRKRLCCRLSLTIERTNGPKYMFCDSTDTSASCQSNCTLSPPHQSSQLFAVSPHTKYGGAGGQLRRVMNPRDNPCAHQIKRETTASITIEPCPRMCDLGVHFQIVHLDYGYTLCLRGCREHGATDNNVLTSPSLTRLFAELS